MFEWEHLIWMVRWKIPKCQTAHRLLLPWDSTVNISLISYPTRWYSHGDVTTVGKTSRHSGRIWSNKPGISGLLRFKLNSILNIMSVPIFLKEKSETTYHCPTPPRPAPGTLADSCSSSFFEILKSTRVCWFVNKHHKLRFDSSFPCLFRQRVGKKQPVGQTPAPSCFCKSFFGTGLCSFVDLFSVAAVTLEGQARLTKLAKFIICPFRGAVCWPLACTWESNAGNVKNTDKT